IAVTLTPVSDPGVHTGHIIRCVWRKSASGGMVIQGILQLYQGETLIAQASNTDISSNTHHTFSYTLSEGEAANITNYSDLGLVVIANNSGGSPARTLVLTALELEVPDVSGGDDIEGEADITLAAATLAATGTVEVAGQLSVTLEAATLSA